MDAASQPHDRRRVPPARAGDRGRAKPPRSPSICPPPTRSLGCGRCSPGGSTGHVITLGVAGSSPARSDVPGGRRSGSPASERPTSCRAITIRRRTGCPGRRQSCEDLVWRGPNTTCSSVPGSRCRPTHPAICRPLGPRRRRSCGSAVVAAAAGTRPSASGCWACSHTATGATTRREHIWRPAAHCRPTHGSRSRWDGRRWVSQSWPRRTRTSKRRGSWPTTAWRSWTTTATGSAPRRRWRRSPTWP